MATELNDIEGGEHSLRHLNEDDRMFGPGFTSAPVHTAEVARMQYLLVTPEMFKNIEAGKVVQTSGPLAIGTHHSSHDADDSKGVTHLEHMTAESSTEGPIDEQNLFHENPLVRVRSALKEPFGEFLGTFILVYFGTASNVQAFLTGGVGGSFLSLSFGWGAGVLLGVLVAGGVSGAHINPAVTVTLATFRGFPWRKVPSYCLAQVLGAFVAGCVVQANYYELVNQFEGGYGVRTFGLSTSSAGVFFTGAQQWMSNIGAFWDEVIGTAFLLIGVLALGDANNNPAPAGMNAIFLLWIVCGIGAANGIQTSFCINPARDLGPRIAGSIFGYPSAIWSDRNGYSIWCCVLGPLTGGLIGASVYDTLIYTGPETPLNRPWGLRIRKMLRF